MKLLFPAFLLLFNRAEAQVPLESFVEKDLPRLLTMYKNLHATPELSYFEQKTAAFVAKELRSLGYEVTEQVGKFADGPHASNGLVAVMKNGNGPTVLLRTDLDALPVEEKTGLPYASRVRARNELGEEVGVMHACGHDLHMTCFLGAAAAMSKHRQAWNGTLVMIGQPAEERGAGAKAMLTDELYTRFPRPDFAIALHANARLPAGSIGWCEGYALANVSSVDIAVRGVGGHGAYPHEAIDPIVIASEVVLALQTIVSREISPLDPSVVTIGSFHGGSQHNIIPDEVRLKITVRSYKEETQQKILSSIKRITLNVAEAAGVPPERAPIIEVNENESTPATYNDPALTRRLTKVLEKTLGPGNVIRVDPVMGGEDFGLYASGRKIPICLFWLGAVNPERFQKVGDGGEPLPSLHSSTFAPLPEPSIHAGVRTLVTAVLELLKK